MIAAIGELLWDVYPDGRRVPGGAPFNFAYHCQQLGHPAMIVSRVGQDALGQELRDEVLQRGLQAEFIQTDPQHPTGTVQVDLNAQQQPTYTIMPDVAWDHLAWTYELQELALDAEVLCFGSLAQRVYPARRTIRKCVSIVSARDQLTICDLNLRPPFLNPSVIYFCLTHSRWLKMSDDDVAVLESLIPHWAVFCDSVALHVRTHGAQGATLTRPGVADPLHHPGVPVDVVDTVGAGDAFTAALACARYEMLPLEQCLRLAVAYAAEVCRYRGGTPKIPRERVAAIRSEIK